MAAKPDAVIAVDGELLRARVAVEIATSKAAASTTRHAEAVEALHDASAIVTQAARAVLDAEMIELAHTFTAALDAALEIGEQLKALASDDPLNRRISAPMTTPPLPVLKALERLPRPNPYDVPLSILRGVNGTHSDARANRLAELSA